MEFRRHSLFSLATSGPYNDTLHSLVRGYIETAKPELCQECSDVDSPEPNFAALQVAFHNITAMLKLHKLIHISSLLVELTPRSCR